MSVDLQEEEARKRASPEFVQGDTVFFSWRAAQTKRQAQRMEFGNRPLTDPCIN